MSKNTKNANAAHTQKRQDSYFRLAKDQGYRSRAAFKMIQLNKKFSFLSQARAAIDLCAAPGGWLQILSKYMPVSSLIIGVDILPIKALPNVVTFQEDITAQSCRAKLKKQLQGWQVDLVVHDGAPNLGGGSSWAKDAYVQNELVLHACKLAAEFLSENGTFVTKIFRSEDYMALTWVLKQFFKKVEVTKPLATREQSSEIFAVCTGYLAPKKIDPRIFDANYIFKLHSEQNAANGNSKVLNVLNMKESRKPNRAGYEDDQSLVFHKTATVSQFLSDADPNKVLAYYNQVIWDDDAQWVKTSPIFTESQGAQAYRLDDIDAAFQDLKVLSKGDFTRLIRWHKKVRQYKIDQERANAGDEEEEEDILELTAEELRANQEAAEAAELNALFLAKEQYEKRLRKKQHEKKMKELNRLALNANNLSERIQDNDHNDELFHLNQLKSEADIKLFKKSAKDWTKGGLTEEQYRKIITTKSGDVDSDLSDADREVLDQEEREWDALSYDEQRAFMIDEQYQAYKIRRSIHTKKDKKAALAAGPDGGKTITGDLSEDELENTKLDADKLVHGKKKSISMNDDDDDDDESEDLSDLEEEMSKGNLNKKAALKKGKNVEEVEKYLKDAHATTKLLSKEKEAALDQANRWFAQDIFNNIDLDNEDERKLLTKHKKEMEKLRKKREELLAQKQRYFAAQQDESDDDDDDKKESQNSTGLRNKTKRKQPSGAQYEEDNAQQKASKKAKSKLLASDEEGYGNGDEEDIEDNFYNSSDEYTETDSSDDDDDDEANPNAPWNQHSKSRWQGTLEDKERDLQKRIEMQQKAEEMIFRQQQQNEAELQVVPQDADQEISEYSDDSDARAEVLALGQKMLRKKSKNSLIESTYNKYSWNDRADLPDWFAEDEAQHNVPQAPITKAEVMAVKNYLKAIDARPISKVAEAKARKQRGAMRRLERQKIHADNILNQEGVSTEQKMKMLEKLSQKKGQKKTALPKQYIMATRNGATIAAKAKTQPKSKKGGKTFTVRVDSRMKKDRQGEARGRWRAKNGNKKRK